MHTADAKEADTDANETRRADGALRSLSTPIPFSMLETSHMLPTPPSTPPWLPTDTFPSPTNHANNAKVAGELLFYHLLGVSSDINGFSAAGNLILDFGPSALYGAE